MNQQPLHERGYLSRCRIAHALVVADRRPEAEVAELLHVQFYDLPDLVRKGAEMMRYQQVSDARPVRHTEQPREERRWTPAQLRMLETNRAKFRAQILKKMAGDA